MNECGWWKSVRWLMKNWINWTVNENDCVMNEEEGVKNLIKMNKWMNVVDESQLDDKWQIKWIEQRMKMIVQWLKKR